MHVEHGHVQRKILVALDNDDVFVDDGAAKHVTIRQLAMYVYDTREPTAAQTFAVRRSMRRLDEKGLIDTRTVTRDGARDRRRPRFWDCTERPSCKGCRQGVPLFASIDELELFSDGGKTYYCTPGDDWGWTERALGRRWPKHIGIMPRRKASHGDDDPTRALGGQRRIADANNTSDDRREFPATTELADVEARLRRLAWQGRARET